MSSYLLKAMGFYEGETLFLAMPLSSSRWGRGTGSGGLPRSRWLYGHTLASKRCRVSSAPRLIWIK